jgi:putative ABC transport system permease protein
MIALNHITQEIRAHKTRFFLTLIAIAWGTATIIGLLSIGEGLRQSFGAAMTNVGKDLLIISPGQTSHAHQGQSAGQKIRLSPLTQSQGQAQHPNLSWQAEYEFSGIPLSHQKQKAPFYSGRAVTPAYQSLRAIQLKTGGRFISPLDMQQHRHVVVLGHQIAQWLFPQQSAVGEWIKLGRFAFQVIGVAKDKLQFSSYGAPDSYQLWIPSTTYQVLSGQNDVQHWIIKSPQPEYYSELIAQLRQMLARQQGFDANDSGALESDDFHQSQQESDQIFFGMQIFLGIVGSLTLIVASIGIANVMFMAVKQSTRQIGMQMAIGAQAYQITLHYLCESLLVTLSGGLLGIGIGAGFVWLANRLPFDPSLFAFMARPNPVLSWPIIVTTLTILCITGLLAGWLPARRAAQVDPVIALRGD